MQAATCCIVCSHLLPHKLATPHLEAARTGGGGVDRLLHSPQTAQKSPAERSISSTLHMQACIHICMCAYLKARVSQPIKMITPETRVLQRWEEGSAFPPYPYSPRRSKFNVSAVLLSLPPSRSCSWEHVPSAWMWRHARDVVGSGVYHKNAVHCSPAAFISHCLCQGSLYSSLHSSPVDVSYGTFLTGSKHLKVPFICHLATEG